MSEDPDSPAILIALLPEDGTTLPERLQPMLLGIEEEQIPYRFVPATADSPQTLMSVGLMMLPAASARFWSRHLAGTLAAAMIIATLASFSGLYASFYLSLPAGPAVVLSAALLFFLSILIGPCGGIFAGRKPLAIR